jgi:hypothetical protein
MKKKNEKILKVYGIAASGTALNYTIKESSVCPHCGYCPACGRSSQTTPSWPYQPYVTNWGGASGSSSYSLQGINATIKVKN